MTLYAQFVKQHQESQKWLAAFFAAMAFFEPRMPHPSFLALGLYAWASGWALAQALRVWSEKGSDS